MKNTRIILSALLVAAIFGLTACGGPSEAETKAIADAKTATAAQLESAAEVADLEVRYQNMLGRAELAEEKVAKYEANEDALVQRETKVKQREAAVKTREAKVKQREVAVSGVEQAIEDSRLSPGTYLVPKEIGAGRYRTVEDVHGTCYMSQDRGSSIINNLLEDVGRPVFTVVASPGTTFTIDSDCGMVEAIA